MLEGLDIDSETLEVLYSYLGHWLDLQDCIRTRVVIILFYADDQNPNFLFFQVCIRMIHEVVEFAHMYSFVIFFGFDTYLVELLKRSSLDMKTEVLGHRPGKLGGQYTDVADVVA